ncbi:MAG TPA: SpoIIE family protein phosphatase [Ktedonobacterales bacterium]|nr:SpoIIE family protein phosphatase [Ktedonobacterales bacterium]
MADAAKVQAQEKSWGERISRMLSGLQFRMSLSYALTSLAAALLIEILFGMLVWVIVTLTPLPTIGYLASARQAADLYALKAAAQAGGGSLDPQTTFEPGKPASIALSQDFAANGSNNWNGSNTSNGENVPYISAGTMQNVPIALLITPDGRVLASSYPHLYPEGSPVSQAIPNRAGPIARALAGTAQSASDTTTQQPVAFATAPVVSRGKTIGAVYVQAPEVTGIPFIQGFLMVWLFSAVFWLALTLPIGGVFGLITTRGVVHRVNRLVDATARFADGDYTQRVRVGGVGEVGQLEQHFNQMAGQLVESMAQRQALVEQQARQEERARIEQDMRTARNIQQSLLPREVPMLEGWHFVPYYRPAQEVGGDFYDFHAFEDGRLGVVIGDVSGEGVPAALVMAITRTMLRTAARATDSPGEALAQVNGLLSADIPPGMFVTCFYALLDPATGQLRYANAGHDLPYHRHHEDVSELCATGMPLGLMPDTRYEELEAILEVDDRVLFYSDGLVEAHNAQREMFGFPRLMQLVGKESDGEPLIDYL